MRSMVSATSGRASPGRTPARSTRGLTGAPSGPLTSRMRPPSSSPALARRRRAPRQQGRPDGADGLAVLGRHLGLEGEQLVAALGLGGGDLAAGQEPVAGVDGPVVEELLLAVDDPGVVQSQV